jgi:hypothetical protein
MCEEEQFVLTFLKGVVIIYFVYKSGKFAVYTVNTFICFKNKDGIYICCKYRKLTEGELPITT